MCRFAPDEASSLACWYARALLRQALKDSTLGFAAPVPLDNGISVMSPIKPATGRMSAVAVGNSGRFAVATAVCDGTDTPSSPNPLLAEVVGEFMTSHRSADGFLFELCARFDSAQVLSALGGDSTAVAQGFNVVVGDGSRVAYYSNRTGCRPETLVPGVYVLSNGLLNTPWPKAEWVRGRFAALACEFVRTLVTCNGTPSGGGVSKVGPANGEPAVTAAAGDGAADATADAPVSRQTNYGLCDALLTTMSDTTAAPFNAQQHVLPPLHYLSLASSPFVLPIPDPRTGQVFGTHTTVIAVMPGEGECLYSQRGLSSAEEQVFTRKDVVFARVTDPSRAASQAGSPAVCASLGPSSADGCALSPSARSLLLPPSSMPPSSAVGAALWTGADGVGAAVHGHGLARPYPSTFSGRHFAGEGHVSHAAAGRFMGSSPDGVVRASGGHLGMATPDYYVRLPGREGPAAAAPGGSGGLLQGLNSGYGYPQPQGRTIVTVIPPPGAPMVRGWCLWCCVGVVGGVERGSCVVAFRSGVGGAALAGWGCQLWISPLLCAVRIRLSNGRGGWPLAGS